MTLSLRRFRPVVFVLAAAAAIALGIACRGGGANPGDVTIPVIPPTHSASSCLDSRYPAEAPQFADVGADAYRTTESGLGVHDVTEGTGALPAAADTIRAHYTGWLSSGCVFDTSHISGTPAVIPLGIISLDGWKEGFTTMKVGGHRRVQIPPQIGFGPVGIPGRIPGNETVYFDMELIEIIDPPIATATAQAQATEAAATRAPQATSTAQARCADNAEDYPADAPKFEDVTADQYTATASGLGIYDVRVGDGPTPADTATVRVHYTGWLENGCIFDSSRPDGEPRQFAVNRVIEGWTEGLSTMQVGGQRRLRVPADLAYREFGQGPLIQPGATLIFDVELLEIVTP